MTTRLILGRVIPARPGESDLPGPDNPLAGPIYLGREEPSACSTCGRRSAFMRDLAAGHIECSHVDCPHRNRITAQPREGVPTHE